MKGFTLIELSVVVAVIGMLATMAIPSYHQRVIRSQLQEAMLLTEAFRKDVVDYHRLNKRFPQNNQALALPEPEKLIGNYVSRVEVVDGAFHIELGNHVNRLVEGQIISLRPLYVKDSPRSPVTWSCGYRTPPPGMVNAGENRTSVDRAFLPFDCF